MSVSKACNDVRCEGGGDCSGVCGTGEGPGVFGVPGVPGATGNELEAEGILIGVIGF